MILGAAWTPLATPTFLTSGRDKKVQIWQIGDGTDGMVVEMKGSVSTTAAVTAVACSNIVTDDGKILFAYGLENGEVGLVKAKVEALDQVEVFTVEQEVAPAKTVNQIVWRPGGMGEGERVKRQFAVASDDSSVRVYGVVDG
ncbi:hypothetical protein PtrV1_06403 [Pyrenophora tritici-repentis]|nr:hypothetical protein PtrV1_06403 [Pyrenophora tritici-repentis]KAF7451123.1 hypothetical protein A1F99_057390 [Pyrenophora tritici-repentis]KAF7573809.1 hypothetical protein PtrM4_087140 [Pyrenophora tritici-repentis]PWO21013.1 DUF1857 domain containing protein [Pyrenophora tritici-repentis]